MRKPLPALKLPSPTRGDPASNREILNMLAKGVDPTFLARVFKKTKWHVEKNLIRVKPIGYNKRGIPLYDFGEAATYLVDFRANLEMLSDEIRIEHLPSGLQEKVWNAKLKKQKFEENAGDLWRSDKVIEVMSDILQNVRSRLQILPDEIDRVANLGSFEMEQVTNLIDSIQNEIHETNIELVRKRNIESSLEEETSSDFKIDDII